MGGNWRPLSRSVESGGFCVRHIVVKVQLLASHPGCVEVRPSSGFLDAKLPSALASSWRWSAVLQSEAKAEANASARCHSRRVDFPPLQVATLTSSYIEKREAFAFLVPKTMIGRRRRWRQLEREKAVRNVFEAQMHARMRRQSLKHVELRRPEALDADCVTLDLGSARSRDTSLEQRERAVRRVINDDKSPQWVPHSIEELGSSSSSSTDTYNILSPGREDEGDELVLKVRQPLTQDACFRLERLGCLDMTLAVPTFEYRVFLGEEKDFSEDATEGSRGVYRLPRLLHNSRVNLPPRSADCYI